MGILRLVLALTVVMGHSSTFFGWKGTGSLVAVQTFFIISGFYMSLILEKKYRGPGSYRLFISNRLLRLFPPYWAVLCFAVLGSVASYLFLETPNIIHRFVNNPEHLSFSSLAFLAFSNLGIVGQDQVMFLGVDAQGYLSPISNFRESPSQLWSYLFIPPTWSISIEIMFYAIAPFLVRRRLAVIIALIGASAALRVYLHKACGLNFDPWTYRFFPTELGLFLMGTVAYRLYLWLPKERLSRTTLVSVTLVFALVTFTFQWLPGGISKKAGYYLLSVLSIPFIFSLSKSWHWDRRVGELSYPVYISHFAFLASFDGFYWIWPEAAWLQAIQQSPHYGLYVMALSIATSLVLLRLVIDPIENYRQARVNALKERV